MDVAYLSASRPGATLGDVLDRGARAYAAAGFPEEWRGHHQAASPATEDARCSRSPRRSRGSPRVSETAVEVLTRTAIVQL